MRMWIPLFVLLFSGLTFGQPSEECSQAPDPCQYLFVIAPDADTIQRFVEAVKEERFALDDSAFGGGLPEDDSEVRVDLPDLYKGLVRDLFGEPITGREGGGIAPLFVKRSDQEDRPLLVVESSNYGPEAFNLEKGIAKQPCSGFLAVFEDLDESRSHEEALKILQEVANRFPNVVFGPDPQTDIGPGAFEGPQAIAEQDGMALGTLSASGDTSLSAQSGEDVTIAVVDTGVSLAHSMIDGFDFVDADSDPSDKYSHVNGNGDLIKGHGTGIADLALRQAENASIMPIRVCSDSDEGSDRGCLGSNVILGTCFALVNTPFPESSEDNVPAPKMLVINLSLGGPDDLSILSAIIGQAINEGALVVASGGNNGDEGPPHYPAANNGTIVKDNGFVTVTATDTNNVLTAWELLNDYLDVAAPGDNIEILQSDGAPGCEFGTSFSAGVVSGLLASLRAEHPAMNSADIEVELKALASFSDPHGIQIVDQSDVNTVFCQ